MTPKFSIVVPTRNRGATLRSALETCIAQDYDNVEIIVSDNYSDDDTHGVVHAFSDHRIKYVNPGKRVSMSENWEHGLGHVTGEYVTFLGDDDGLLPGAVRDVASIFDKTGTPALTWLKAEYCWPDHILGHYRNYIQVPLQNRLVRYEAGSALRDVSRLWLPYNRTPTLYNSFVSTEVLRRLKQDGKPFFRCIIPDVYSGIVILSEIGTYLHSVRPFSVNGASAASTGTSQFHRGNDKSAAQSFLSEIDAERDIIFGIVYGSVTSAVLESLMQADRHRYMNSLRLNVHGAVRKIMREISPLEGDEYERALEQLLVAAKKHGLDKYVRRRPKKQNSKIKNRGILRHGLDERGCLAWDASRFGLRDVKQACDFLGGLLGPYELPQAIGEYSIASRVYSRLIRLTCRLNLDRTL